MDLKKSRFLLFYMETDFETVQGSDDDIMMKHWHTLFPAAGMVLLCLTASACGDGGQETVLSREQPELLLEILDDMRAKRYETALPKIRKYQAAEELNNFLPELENKICPANMCIAEIRKLLNESRFAEAEAYMHEMQQKYGTLDELVEVAQFVKALADAEKLLNKFDFPMTSAEMRQTAEDFKRLVHTLPGSADMEQWADAKIAEAAELEKLEKERPDTLLYALAEESGDSAIQDSAAALIAVDNPRSPLVNKLMNNGRFDYHSSPQSNSSTGEKGNRTK